MSYFSKERNTFIYSGLYPNLNADHCWIEEIDFDPELLIKFRIRSVPLVDEAAINLKSKTERKNVHKRTKERKIGDVGNYSIVFLTIRSF